MQRPIKIQFPEEKMQIQVSIEQLINFQQKVPIYIINYLRQQYSSSFSQKILHVFLYFIAFIQKKPHLPENYEQLCRAKLIDQYIRHKMNIDIYTYSLICSRLLQRKVDQCFHTCFYLVYGKLMSVPYANSVCHNRLFKDRKNVVMKTNKSMKDFYKSKDKIKADKSIQFKNFASELKHTLCPSNDDINMKDKIQQSFTTEQLKIISQGTCFLYIPKRVHYKDNSALVNQILQRTPLKTQVIRKRKFKDTVFDWNNEIPKKHEEPSKTHHNQQKIQQNVLKNQNFNNIVSKIRQNNINLQLVRQNCKSDRNIEISKRIINIMSSRKQNSQQKVQLMEMRQNGQKLMNKKHSLSDDQEDVCMNKTVIKNVIRKSVLNKFVNQLDQEETHFTPFIKKKPMNRLRKYRQQYKLFSKDQLFVKIDPQF